MACDFFHVDTVLLRRLYVLVHHHDSRLVRIAGVTAMPVTGWVRKQARNISMEFVDHASAIKFLIRDSDTKFTASFDAVFAADGVRILKTPVRAPRANAIYERVIGTLRRECLEQMIILGRRHVEAVLAEYVSITTRTARIALSTSVRRPRSMRLRCLSTTSTPTGYEKPTVWVASSTSTGWSPELDGWGSRHPQAPRANVKGPTTRSPS